MSAQQQRSSASSSSGSSGSSSSSSLSSSNGSGSANNGNKPVHTVRHRSIKATIWKNDTSNGPMYNVTVNRSYRDDNGEWKDSQSIGYDDLMNVAALMYEAHAYISSLRVKESGAKGHPADAGNKSRR